MPKEASNAKSSPILLVEDDPDICESIEAALKYRNFQLEIINSGDQVKDYVCAHKPKLIILDIMLPKVNGVEICKELKSKELTRSIPIIFLSAKAQSFEVEEGLRAGGDCYITKPFNHQELLKHIQRLLG